MDIFAVNQAGGHPEDGGSKFLQNVGNHLIDFTVTTQKTTIKIYTPVKTSDSLVLLLLRSVNTTY
jgi:hypothetical protein